MLRRLSHKDNHFKAALNELLARNGDAVTEISIAVAAIIAEIRSRGEAALIEYTTKFDRFDAAAVGLKISEAEIASAMVAPEVEAALKLAAERIRAFHSQTIPHDVEYVDALGVKLGQRWTPVDVAGIYVPGGLAAYPSTVLMNAIPALAAGVKKVVMAVPAPDGKIAPAVLVAARIAGVNEIYRIGGAQAVAALAFGTGTIPKVDKIAGPGNAYVAEAKRQLYGMVGIDSIAGPSEILVVADAKTNPEWVAADMLSQAEHDKQASSILITDDAAFADDVTAAVLKIMAKLPRQEIAAASIKNHGAIIIVGDIATDAPAIIDHIAPEHLELMVDEPEKLMAKISHAGAFFLGRHTPEALGDYLAGPSHVLPTAGTARFSSGLSVMDFMKRSSVINAPASAMADLRAATETLAAAEGLQAHGLSAGMRKE